MGTAVSLHNRCNQHPTTQHSDQEHKNLLRNALNLFILTALNAMRVNSAKYAYKGGYAASDSSYDPHFHSMLNLSRELHCVQDNIQKNVRHIMKFGSICRTPFGIFIVRAVHKLAKRYLRFVLGSEND